MQEVIDLWKKAVRHEALTVNFYSRASEVTDNDESRMLFIQLSEMEGGHIQELVDQAAKSSCMKDSGVDLKDYADSLESDEGHEFSDEEEKAFVAGDMRTVLEIALRHERGAVAMYGELQQKTSDNDTKTFCKEQVENEKKHVHELETMLNSLDLSAEDRPGL
ncbi:ferritin family protein [Magnetococcus sp. PR-3]|uniref:ferritin family protein n=1 Tax=Magnetococcus sp. PR-3 TaxID=3120355 RepID=UPI002FCE2A5C